MYCFQERITSGARYHLVATYSVKKPFQSSEGLATRANPKSQIFSEQSPFTKRLLGFLKNVNEQKMLPNHDEEHVQNELLSFLLGFDTQSIECGRLRVLEESLQFVASLCPKVLQANH